MQPSLFIQITDRWVFFRRKIAANRSNRLHSADDSNRGKTGQVGRRQRAIQRTAQRNVMFHLLPVVFFSRNQERALLNILAWVLDRKSNQSLCLKSYYICNWKVCATFKKRDISFFNHLWLPHLSSYLNFRKHMLSTDQRLWIRPRKLPESKINVLLCSPDVWNYAIGYLDSFFHLLDKKWTPPIQENDDLETRYARASLTREHRYIAV